MGRQYSNRCAPPLVCCTAAVSLLQIPKADKAEALYAKYTDAEEDGIGPEGTLLGC